MKDMDDEHELLILWQRLDDGRRAMLLDLAREVARWREQYR